MPKLIRLYHFEIKALNWIMRSGRRDKRAESVSWRAGAKTRLDRRQAPPGPRASGRGPAMRQLFLAGPGRVHERSWRLGNASDGRLAALPAAGAHIWAAPPGWLGAGASARGALGPGEPPPGRQRPRQVPSINELTREPHRAPTNCLGLGPNSRAGPRLI